MKNNNDKMNMKFTFYYIYKYIEIFVLMNLLYTV